MLIVEYFDFFSGIMYARNAVVKLVNSDSRLRGRNSVPHIKTLFPQP